MKLTSLTKLLTSYGNCTEKAGEYAVSEGNAVTLYVGIGNETLMVTSIESLKFEEEMVIATTDKKEMYVVAVEDIRSLRFGKSSVKKPASFRI